MGRSRSRSAIEGKVESLPQWAQKRIEHLEGCLQSNRDYYQKKVDEIGGKTETPVELETGNHKTFIPKDSEIRWHLRDGSVLSVRYDKDEDCIRIHKEGRIIHKLIIMPYSSNVAEVN